MRKISVFILPSPAIIYIFQTSRGLPAVRGVKCRAAVALKPSGIRRAPCGHLAGKIERGKQGCRETYTHSILRRRTAKDQQTRGRQQTQTLCPQKLVAASSYNEVASRGTPEIFRDLKSCPRSPRGLLKPEFISQKLSRASEAPQAPRASPRKLLKPEFISQKPPRASES